jgi:glycosyltransferase involved in cell wall biosynthesis
MRILLAADPILPVPPVRYGGIERIVDTLVRHFLDAGNTVTLIAHRDSTSPATTRIGWPGRRVQSRVDTVRNAIALRRVVRAVQPDIVHSFARLAYLTLELRSARPKIMSYQRHTGGRALKWVQRLAGPTLTFTGCSEYICNLGRRAGGDWVAIPNFTDVEKIVFVPQVARDAPLVFLSRIELMKGPDLAIAIARAAGRRLILAGNRADRGSERNYWERAIAPHLGRDGIEYIGEVDDEQKAALLGSAAALLVPVQWDEPFGIVFVEALAAGTPVISCSRGALPEIIEHGRTGFLIQSIADGMDAVRQLPSLNRTACRQAAATRFDSRQCAARYLALYRDVLPSPPTPVRE